MQIRRTVKGGHRKHIMRGVRLYEVEKKWAVCSYCETLIPAEREFGNYVVIECDHTVCDDCQIQLRHNYCTGYAQCEHCRYDLSFCEHCKEVQEDSYKYGVGFCVDCMMVFTIHLKTHMYMFN